MRAKNRRSRSAMIWIGLFSVAALAALTVMLTKEPRLVGAAAGKQTAAKNTVELTRIPHPDTKEMRVVQLGRKTIDGLLEELSVRGSKIEVNETKDGGITLLQLKVDEIALSPIVADCPICEVIVFEY